ncbi:MAG: periplasmic heavy metal sensor [Ignavibacteriaceae bacterium]|nr:periplasmic heavy metal sensor [Ignavibacteriaceae bacterium]
MRIRIISLAVLIAAIMISQDLFAQEMMIRKRDRDHMQLHQKLNLTAEQQEKIDALKLGHQKEMIDLRANLERKNLELVELKSKGNYTREEFLSKTNEIISARNKIALSFANHQMDIYQLLDDNQKKEWNKFSHDIGEQKNKRMMKMIRNIDADIEMETEE